MNTRRIVLVMIAASFGAASLYAYKEYTRKNTDLRKAKAVFHFQADNLIAEFEKNSSAANKKYLGKIISVQGQIQKLEKDEQGQITIALGKKDELICVRCILDTVPGNNTASLEKGNHVKIKGSLIGFDKDETGLLGSDIKFNKCIIED